MTSFSYNFTFWNYSLHHSITKTLWSIPTKFVSIIIKNCHSRGNYIVVIVIVNVNVVAYRI